MKHLVQSVWTILIVVWLCFGWLSPTVAVAQVSPQALSGDKDKATQLVVQLTGKLAGTETIGLGIIFGLENHQLFIATANHVVRMGTSEAQNLQIEFKFRPGDVVKANLLNRNDKDLDLAVLSVNVLGKDSIYINNLLWNRLGDVSVLQPGDTVHSSLERWIAPQTPERINKVVNERITFESNFIAPGHSGGGLFNDRWELVGMTRAIIISSFVEAISIESILKTLKDWNYPVNLVRAKPPSPDSSITKGKKWPWLLGGIAVIGGVALAVILGDGDGDGGLPDPPPFPPRP